MYRCYGGNEYEKNVWICPCKFTGTNEERQVVAMQEFGVPDNCMVIEKQSGKDFNRPGYKRLLKKLSPHG